MQTEDYKLDLNKEVVALGNLRLETVIAARNLANYNDPLVADPVLPTIDEEEAIVANKVLESTN